MRLEKSIGRQRKVCAAALAALASAMTLNAVLTSQVSAQRRSAAESGHATFEHLCEPCHGDGPGDDGRAMLPGTDALRIKYRGALPALLEERSDLTAEALKVYVRRGTFSMPPFRPTEITDAEIENIAAYLQESSKR